MNSIDGKQEALHFLGVVDGIKNIPIKDESLILITAIFANESRKGFLNINIKKLAKIINMSEEFINEYIENLLYWGFLFPTNQSNEYFLNSYFNQGGKQLNEYKDEIKLEGDDEYREAQKRFKTLLEEVSLKYKDSDRFTEDELKQGEIQYLLNEAMGFNSRMSGESLALMNIVNDIAAFCEERINKYGKGFESAFVKIESDYRFILESYILCREQSQHDLTSYEKLKDKEGIIDCINKDSEDIERFNLCLAERASSLRDLITKRSVVDYDDKEKMINMVKSYNKSIYNDKRLKISAA